LRGYGGAASYHPVHSLPQGRTVPSTTEITRNRDAQGYEENHDAAVEGGTVAGSARKDLERKSGKRVSTRENFKEIPKAKKKKIGLKCQDIADPEVSRHR
jgi:hypothetical protein